MALGGAGRLVDVDRALRLLGWIAGDVAGRHHERVGARGNGPAEQSHEQRREDERKSHLDNVANGSPR
jgi:hypothetical protein